MVELLAIFTLLLPGGLLWFRWRVQYDGKFPDTIETRICLVIMGSYIVVILLFGAPAVAGYDDELRRIRRFLSAFLLPGIGFAVILFPEMAARVADHYLYLARMDALKGYTIMGWMILAISIGLLLVRHG